ncbi:MAG: hypothetical protein D6706_09280 [Chloroflexi bacterium]|nr:MAG: hypothetical protein D6706_09280 [Chloroflexota bacterium]
MGWTPSYLQLIAKPQGNINAADGFALLGFGLRRENGRLTPGDSNLALARWLIQHNPHKHPTITQQGTYLALKTLATQQPHLSLDNWVINLPHDDRVHVDTHGAALQIWLLAQQHHIRRLCLVTHPWQSERARRIFSKLPLDELIIPDYTQIHIPFDPQSIQRWTRGRLHYLFFELCMARPIGHLFGWL